MIISFHEGMIGTVQYDGSSSDPFPIKSGVKQGCVPAPTLFGIFSLLLHYAFHKSEDDIFLHTRSDGNLFNLARLKAKTKVNTVLIRKMLFVDNAALAAHTEDALTLSHHPLWRPHPGGGGKPHLPRLQHLQRSVTGC